MSPRIYLFHAIFWSVMLVRLLPRKERVSDSSPTTAAGAGAPSDSTQAAPQARFVLFVHAIGFGCMYWSIGQSVFGPDLLPPMFEIPWPIGAAVILLGGALFAWALLVFDSWRILAKLESGHRLCTIGPYHHLRNPIYAACDLLAVGTYLWHPTPPQLFAAFFLHLGAELRARTEEKVLLDRFGDEYRNYVATTKRFVPGIY